MYEPHDLLARIDQHTLPILGVCVIAMVANYTLYIEALRVGRRLRMVTLPVFCTMFWLMHDASYVARFDTWFTGYHHWYTELFWVALVISVGCELALTAQIIAYGRAEFAPFLTQRQWTLAVGGALGLLLGTWLVVKDALDDDLYAWTFGALLITYPLAGLTTMAKRRSVRGFTPLQPASLTIMCAGWFTASIAWFGPGFRSLSWVLLAVLSTSSAAFMTWVAVRFREPAPPAPATSSAHPNRRSEPTPERIPAGGGRDSQ